MTVTPHRPQSYGRRPPPRYSRYPAMVPNRRLQPSKQAADQPRKSWRRSVQVALVFCLTLALASHFAWTKHVSAEQLADQHAQAVMAVQESERTAAFASQVNAVIAANPAVAISVTAVSGSGVLRQYGSDTTFDGASTGKLITAADYLHHVELGQASLNQQIDGQSAKALLRAMIVNSDDASWLALNDYLTHADLSQYGSKLGITDYDPDGNTFRSSDMAVLLQKLWSGGLLNFSNSQLLLGYMKQANYRSFMVPAIPAGYTIYHKVGLDNDTVNEAAIITHGTQHSVLVIFTDGNGTYDWTERAQIIQAITQDALAAYL
jgi:beta-lactamase class A